MDNVALALPSGAPILEVDRLRLDSGQSVASTGASGSGKSTLFRAMAGIWPFSRGRVLMPPDIAAMVIRAKPYIPIGPLRAGISYPAIAGTYNDDDIQVALVAARIGELANDLERNEVWSQRLSSG